MVESQVRRRGQIYLGEILAIVAGMAGLMAVGRYWFASSNNDWFLQPPKFVVIMAMLLNPLLIIGFIPIAVVGPIVIGVQSFRGSRCLICHQLYIVWQCVLVLCCFMPSNIASWLSSSLDARIFASLIPCGVLVLLMTLVEAIYRRVDKRAWMLVAMEFLCYTWF